MHITDPWPIGEYIVYDLRMRTSESAEIKDLFGDRAFSVAGQTEVLKQHSNINTRYVHHGIVQAYTQDTLFREIEFLTCDVFLRRPFTGMCCVTTLYT